MTKSIGLPSFFIIHNIFLLCESENTHLYDLIGNGKQAYFIFRRK